MGEFNKGKRIRVNNGGELEILEKLGEGGQGIVYRVRYNGEELALKWYFKNKLANKAENTIIVYIGNVTCPRGMIK